MDSEARLKANERYNSLPPMERRVATAKEVLLQMERGAFVAGQGWGTVDGISEAAIKEANGRFPLGDLQQAIHEDRFFCIGCAKAAALIARASLGNNVHVTTANNHNKNLSNEAAYDVFGKECADIMEGLYEDFSAEYGSRLGFLPTEEVRSAYTHYIRSLPFDRGLRLRAIYQNIIDNEGRLVIGDFKF